MDKKKWHNSKYDRNVATRVKENMIDQSILKILKTKSKLLKGSVIKL